MNEQELVGSVVRGIKNRRYGVVTEVHDNGDIVSEERTTGAIRLFASWCIQLPGGKRGAHHTIEVLDYHEYLGKPVVILKTGCKGTIIGVRVKGDDDVRIVVRHPDGDVLEHNAKTLRLSGDELDTCHTIAIVCDDVVSPVDTSVHTYCVITDDTMLVIGKYGSMEEADEAARKCAPNNPGQSYSTCELFSSHKTETTKTYY
jgi:hypothetical protein